MLRILRRFSSYSRTWFSAWIRSLSRDATSAFGREDVEGGGYADVDLDLVLLEKLLGQFDRFPLHFQVLVDINQVPVSVFDLIDQVNHALFEG